MKFPNYQDRVCNCKAENSLHVHQQAGLSLFLEKKKKSIKKNKTALCLLLWNNLQDRALG